MPFVELLRVLTWNFSNTIEDEIMSASTEYAFVLGIAAVIFLWIGRRACIHSEEVRKRTSVDD